MSVAFVGTAGSGKTTLIAAIIRALEVSSSVDELILERSRVTSCTDATNQVWHFVEVHAEQLNHQTKCKNVDAVQAELAQHNIPPVELWVMCVPTKLAKHMRHPIWIPSASNTATPKTDVFALSGISAVMMLALNAVHNVVALTSAYSVPDTLGVDLITSFNATFANAHAWGKLECRPVVRVDSKLGVLHDLWQHLQQIQHGAAISESRGVFLDNLARASPDIHALLMDIKGNVNIKRCANRDDGIKHAQALLGVSDYALLEEDALLLGTCIKLQVIASPTFRLEIPDAANPHSMRCLHAQHTFVLVDGQNNAWCTAHLVSPALNAEDWFWPVYKLLHANGVRSREERVGNTGKTVQPTSCTELAKFYAGLGLATIKQRLEEGTHDRLQLRTDFIFALLLWCLRRENC